MMTLSSLRRVLLRRYATTIRQLRSRRQHSGKSDPSPTKNLAKEEGHIAPPNTTPKLSIWQRLGPLSRAAEAYGRTHRKRPLLTQLCSSLVVFSCGDLSAQLMGGKDYDPIRTLRSIVIGGVSAIPSFKWFVWLSQSFNFSSRLLSLATRVVVNQLCFVPVFGTYFFSMQAALAGENVEAIWDRVRRGVPVSFANSWKVWPAATAFSFTYIPLEYRSLFSGVIAVGWQTYMSYLNRMVEEAASKESKEQPEGQLSKVAGSAPTGAAIEKMAA